MEQVLSKSAGRGKRCNSLLSLLDLWESSASFLHTASVHSGLREIEEHYLFIFTHSCINLPTALHLCFPLFDKKKKKKNAITFISWPLFNSRKVCNRVLKICRHSHLGDFLKSCSIHHYLQYKVLPKKLQLLLKDTLTAITV